MPGACCPGPGGLTWSGAVSCCCQGCCWCDTLWEHSSPLSAVLGCEPFSGVTLIVTWAERKYSKVCFLILISKLLLQWNCASPNTNTSSFKHLFYTNMVHLGSKTCQLRKNFLPIQDIWDAVILFTPTRGLKKGIIFSVLSAMTSSVLFGGKFFFQSSNLLWQHSLLNLVCRNPICTKPGIGRPDLVFPN